MQIPFATERLRKTVNDERALTCTFGPEQARVISQRLAAMRAAESLATLMRLPGRCHALTGDRSGQFALDLRGPYRMIFEPADEPEPRDMDGRLIYGEVTAVRILAAKEDYHG